MPRDMTRERLHPNGIHRSRDSFIVNQALSLFTVSQQP
jgi:hypothetical protein